MARGSRSSDWQVMRRCLAIICRVQRGPCDWHALVEAVCSVEGQEAYGEPGGAALQRRVQNDLHRIREHLLIEIGYSRQEGGYVIRDTWLPLLDMPDGDLLTLAWLERVFDLQSPQHDEVQGLIDRLRSYLDPTRRGMLARQSRSVQIELTRRDDENICPVLLERLGQALTHRQRIEFDYLSPTYADGVPRRHRVDPQHCWFDAAYGHFYLQGWCHHSDGPEGRQDCGDYRTFRLGRISNLAILPDKLPPTLPPARRYEVIYELAAEIARGGVSRHAHIETLGVEERPDGSALVRGTTESVFWATQELIHYQHRCRVLGGPELLLEMRRTVRKMTQLYDSE